MAEKEKKGILAEFKEFISRGNVLDMAVGIIIGSAFTAIVNSLVKDMIMPIVGFIIGGINFTDFKIVLSQAVGDTPEVAICYGTFLQQLIDFLIIAFVVFMMVKAINVFHRKKKKEEPAPAELVVPDDIKLLQEIRDLLKESGGSPLAGRVSSSKEE